MFIELFLKPATHPCEVRQHAEQIKPEYTFLTKTVSLEKFDGDKPLSKSDVEEDLDEFEWLLENRFSYLSLKNTDYKSALDAIRLSAGNGLRRGELAYKLHKLMVLFGDGHSLVEDPDLERLCSGFLPFLVEECDNRLLAIQPDHSNFVNSEHPVLKTLDGIDIAVWLSCAEQLATRGSDTLLRYQTVHNLRYVDLLRKELGIGKKEQVEIGLESLDGQKQITVSLELLRSRPSYGEWPNTQSGILKDNIGYLRILPNMDPREKFLNGLIQKMQNFKNTSGLVIDIRDNRGGSRKPLDTLFPFFMSADEPAQIINVSAYKLGVPGTEVKAEVRFLFTKNSKQYSESEKKQIESFATRFKPEWDFSKQQFGDWHYCLIRAERSPEYYEYKQPVIILMNARNFSACDIFLGAFKGRPNITLMGSKSSGGSGCPIKYRLHHSLISIRLSSMISFQANGKLYDGRGIEPDIFCDPVPGDFIGRGDSILDKALETLSKNKL